MTSPVPVGSLVGCLFIMCCLVGITQAEGEPPGPAGGIPRLILNDDGETAPPGDGRTLRDYLAERFRYAVDTQVDAYFICVGSTDRGPAAGGVPKLQDTQNRWFPDKKPDPEIDKMTKAYLEAAHKAGMQVFASLRMNDIHDAWAPKLTYPLKMKRPDLLLGQKQAYPKDALMRAFWSGFDYARKEVRQHFLEFIATYCPQYDYDGLELDYFRHPLFFKLGEAERNLDTMTGFVRQVRRTLDDIGKRRGKPYRLAIRAPDTPQMARLTGLDVERWLKEGLVDMLIVGGGYMPYAGRLKEFIDLAHRYGVPAYPCINHFQEPVKMRSCASNFWALGADGVYVFNFFGLPKAPEKQKCLHEMGSPQTLAGLDKLFLPDAGANIFYCGMTNAPSPFPVSLIHGAPVELVVGDDVRAAAAKGLLQELLLTVKVANVGPQEGIVVRVNDRSVPPERLRRTSAEAFAVRLPPSLVRRGINHFMILPGPDSVGRLSSAVTGLALAVGYKR